MASDANITDVGALDEFRRALIRFREELNAALAEADSEVKSTFVWLERDRMLHWRRAVPKLDEELTSAKSALFRKEAQTMGSGQRPSTIDEKKEVERVKRRCEDARERLDRTRRWLATLERDVSLFKSAMSPVSSMVDRDLPDAILRLRNMALALEAYLATPSVSLGEQLERARTRVASMRRAGEHRSAEDEMQADREKAELEADEKALAAAPRRRGPRPEGRRGMSLSDSKARINAAHRDLMNAWHKVSDVWRDDTARAFRERSIEPIDRSLRAAMNALDAMEDTLRRVRNDCGDR